MLLYRVFPHIDDARRGEPGHPLYIQPRQGMGRWDNPDKYLVRYLAVSPECAIGEAFAHLKAWTPAMLRRPDLPGSERRIAVFQFDETTNPLIDLDDAATLVRLGLRPTDVVIRNRPKTQTIAAQIFDEGRWAGIRSWSYHRPQWPVVALWTQRSLKAHSILGIAGHPALEEAADTLRKLRRGI